jgi:hypothetical protein
MNAAPPTNRATVCLLGLAAGPLVLALSASNGAIVRYTTTLPLGVSCVVAAALTVAVCAWVLRVAAPRVTAAVAAIALGTTLLGCLLLFARLWRPELHGMATIGGGDAGHHVWIANQLAHNHPRVYQGFTSFHAATWAFGQLLGGPFEGVRAAFFVGIAGWLSAGSLILVLATREAKRPWLAAGVGALLLLAIWFRIHLVWAHYNQADGFFAHIHGAASVLCLVLAAGVSSHWLQRALLLAAGVVVFRFTYALNAGDVLLACAAVVAGGAWSRRGEPKLRAALLAGAAAAVVVAAIAYAMLWPKIGKPGGIMAPDPAWNLAALAAGAAACVMWRRERPVAPVDDPAILMTRFAALLAVVPIFTICLFFALPDLPQEYYFHKYPLTALIALTGVAPAIAGRQLDAWLGSDLSERLSARNIGLLAAVMALLLLHVRATDNAGAVMRHGYLERAGDTVEMRQVERLHDPVTERVARRVMRTANAERGRYLNPRWPVFNFTDNVLNAWHPSAKRPVKGLQDERWQLFLHGALPEPGSCVFWPSTPATAQRYAALCARLSHATVCATIEKLKADSNRNCATLRADKPQEALCWLCK